MDMPVKILLTVRTPPDLPLPDLRAEITTFGGLAVRISDDERAALFGNFARAMACAEAIQCACAWRARVSVNVATTLPRNGRIAGPGPVRAVALLDQAKDGEIVYSTICDGDRTGIVTRKTAGQGGAAAITTSRRLPLLLQYGALLGFFGFWFALIFWRTILFALDGGWSCWPTFLCG